MTRVAILGTGFGTVSNMNKVFLTLVTSVLLFCSGNAFAGQLFCQKGWPGGDHGYDAYVEIIVSDKPIKRYSRRGEADPGYKIQKGSQSAAMSLSVGWDNKEMYGDNAVLSYGERKGTKPAFAKANYGFAKKCLTEKISPSLRKELAKAVLNPKIIKRK